MKNLLLLLLISIVASCTPRKANDPEPAPTEIKDTILLDTDHTAKNSLDYLGTYKGKFPCAKCPDEITLELSEEFNYTMTRISGNKKLDERSGTFKWAGNQIILSGETIMFNKLRVSENKLTPTSYNDSIGLRLKGKQAAEFEMLKLSDAEAVKTDESPQDKLPPEIIGIQWKLSEINSKPHVNKSTRDHFIKFSKDGSFSAFSGCNNMGGKYEFKGSKIRMFNIISTMMACPEPDMKTEDDFKKALETADNFVANEKVLQFRKGGVNLLKFEAVARRKP